MSINKYDERIEKTFIQENPDTKEEKFYVKAYKVIHKSMNNIII
jgi:hypothetical protein